MDWYRPIQVPRRRRGPTTARRRRGRAVAPTAPRLWWMALALLLAVLLLPLGARAQGLHSASATVTLMAVKSEPQMVVRDWALPLHEDGGLVVAVRLPDESAAQPLYVRNRFGRLERLGAGWTAVQPGTLRFRVVRPAGGPAMGWRMEVSMRDTVTGATRESVVSVSAR